MLAFSPATSCSSSFSDVRVLAVRPLFEKKLGRGTARDCENQNFRLETRGQSGKVPGLQLPAKTHRFCPRRTTQHTMCQLMGMQVSLHSIRVHLLVGLSQLPKERVLDIQRACAGNADSSTLYRAAGVAGIESMIWCTRNLVGGLAHQTLKPIFCGLHSRPLLFTDHARFLVGSCTASGTATFRFSSALASHTRSHSEKCTPFLPRYIVRQVFHKFACALAMPSVSDSVVCNWGGGCSSACHSSRRDHCCRTSVCGGEDYFYGNAKLKLN